MPRSFRRNFKFDAVIGINYYAPHISGLSEAARMLAERLVVEGLKVRVVCCRHNHDLPKFEIINGVEIERVPILGMIRNGPICPQLPFRLARRSRRARLINLHLPMLESGLVSALSRAPVSIVTYQCDFVGPRSLLGKLIELTMDVSNRFAIKQADHVVVSSHDYANQSRLAKNLVNAIAIQPPFKSREKGLPTFRCASGFHYGFLGRASAEKGLTYLIQAFQQCARPDDRLLIGGEGSKRIGESIVDEVATLVESDSRINILGFIDEGKMSDFYASIDAFVFPSVNRLEAFGIVQMESLSAGVPVVASNIPGVRTIVLETRCGLLAEPGDTRDLARVMIAIREFKFPDSYVSNNEKSLDDYVTLVRSTNTTKDQNST